LRLAAKLRGASSRARLRACLAPLLLAAAPASAAPPALKSVFPPGARQGADVTITLDGAKPADRVWVSAPGVVFDPPNDKGATVVRVHPRAEPGIVLIRLVNEEGVSEPRRFVIGLDREQNEEGNPTRIDTAMEAGHLPVVINGRLSSSGEMDHYAVDLDEGQQLFAHAAAYTIGSPVDAMLHVTDADGTRLATASDSRNLDPELKFTAPAKGRYIIQVAGFVHPPAANVEFTGGSAVIYRLAFSHQAPVPWPRPAAVWTKSFRSPDDGAGVPLAVGDFSAPLGRVMLARLAGMPGPVQLVATPAQPVLEREPNDDAATAMKLPMPAAVHGVISKADDSDWFSVPVKKGQKLRAEIHAQRLGMPLDASLRIVDEAGATLASNDDQSATPDPLVNWTAAADGAHFVRVTDQFQQGGETHDYVLVVSEPQPDFSLAIADGKPVSVTQGETVTVKAALKRLDGWKEALALRVEGLPEIVRLEKTVIPEKDGDVEAHLTVPADCPPGPLPFRLVVTGKGADHTVTRAARYDLRGDSLRGTSLSDTDDTLWLLVKKAPETKPEKDAPAAKKQP
jgi:hypothetical protein